MDAGNEVNNVDYVIVLGDTNIVCVDVPETATLAELRVEIELAANDIDEIPREFAFLVKGGRFLQRKEASRKVSTVTGNHRVYIEQLGVARESRAPVAAAPGSRATGRATQEGVAIDNDITFPPRNAGDLIIPIMYKGRRDIFGGKSSICCWFGPYAEFAWRQPRNISVPWKKGWRRKNRTKKG